MLVTMCHWVLQLAVSWKRRGGGKEGGREEERDRGKAGGRIGGIERRGWKHISYLFDQTSQLLFKGGVYSLEACRHQRQPDKLHMSNTVTTVRRCQ